MQRFTALFLATALFAVGCAKPVSLTLVAPSTFAGGTVKVDGQVVARFERFQGNLPGVGNESRPTEGAIADFGLEVGEHVITIQSDRQPPLNFRVRYDKGTEDHVVIDGKTVEKLKEARSAPLLEMMDE